MQCIKYAEQQRYFQLPIRQHQYRLYFNYSPNGIKMHLICLIVICFYVSLDFTESLLNQGPVRNGQTDQIILDLQRNFSFFKHEMALQLSLLRQKQTNEILVQNQTITAQRLKILELEQKQKTSAAMIMEQNKTIVNQEQKIADQDKKIVMLENNMTNIDRRSRLFEQTADNLKLRQNATIIKTTVELQEVDRQHQQKISEIDGRLNQSFSSYEVILHDVVNKQNQYAATYTNQTRTLNQSVVGLSKQFHYLALSIQDAERRTTLLINSFNRKCVILKFVTF